MTDERESLLQRLQDQILTDIRAAIDKRVGDASVPPAYGFVIHFQPIHGSLGWRFHDVNTERAVDASDFNRPGGHPEGPRFDVGDCLSDPPISPATRKLLLEYARVIDALMEDEPDNDDSTLDCSYDSASLRFERRFEDMLVDCVHKLAPNFATLPKTNDFVAFISDWDDGALHWVRKTVSDELVARVFPDLPPEVGA